MEDDYYVIPGLPETKAAFRAGRCLPLLPRHHAYLTVWSGGGPTVIPICLGDLAATLLRARRKLLAY